MPTAEPQSPVTEDYVRQTVARLRSDFPESDHAGLVYALACDVLINLFGREWSRDHLFDRASELAIAGEDAGSPHTWRQHRLTRLAEALFVMQGTAGFQGRLSRARGDLLSAVLAEMELGRAFRALGGEVAFVEETGRRGHDFDFEVRFADQTPSHPVEVKSKVDGEPNHKTLWRRLDQARQQLPADRVGIVCARLPASWAAYGTLPLTAITAVNQLFRKTRRVGLVVVQWESVDVHGSSLSMISVRREAYSNPGLREEHPWIVDIAKRVPTAGDGFTLRDFVSAA